MSTKPAAQIAFREAYYSGYGPAPVIKRSYDRNAQRYCDLYYRLHAEADGPIDRVRRAVTGASAVPVDCYRVLHWRPGLSTPGLVELAYTITALGEADDRVHRSFAVISQHEIVRSHVARPRAGDLEAPSAVSP